MKETVEFRLPESEASGLLASKVGRTIGGTTRVITVEPTDPLYAALRMAERSRRERGAGSLFYSWDIRRTYDDSELAEAELLHVLPIGGFQPVGEECGTQYDESTACPVCGAGRTQISPLALDLRKVQPDRDIETQTIPRHKDLARSIADEVVISDRLARGLRAAAATGFELRPVTRCNGAEEIDGWRQLVVLGGPVEAIPPTTYGIDPFDLDVDGVYRCPRGHVAGLNLLSEITIDRSTWHREDLVVTKQWVGDRRGLLVPTQSILMSGRLFRLLARLRFRGLRFEVAHLA